MAHHTTERERVEARTQPPTGDPLIGRTEEAAIDAERARRAANLFDLRRLIGGLFVLYGAILTVLGIGASDEEIDRAAGINLNLWVGLAMLAVGALFLVWAFARPLGEQLEEDEDHRDEDDRTVPGAPAPIGPDAAALAGSQTTSRRARRDRVGTGGDGRFTRE